ncbi:MAG: GNAT family N-acetyltransferase [Candidatus Goldbacteria bacterium]|nr:GNAT family N-acetyltransferase [Candidatus Goldiibacteriota bacterium]
MEYEFLVRRAGLSDMQVLVDFVEALFLIEKNFRTGRKNHENGLLEIICGGRGAVFLAECNGKAAGMATAQIVISTSAGGVSLLVEDVFVAEQYRGKGAGRLLMDEVKRWGLKNGALRMQLVADKTNKYVIDFYKKLGWEESIMMGLYYNF